MPYPAYVPEEVCGIPPRRPAQAQRRRAVRRCTCGSAGWRHTCLIRPTFLRKPAGYLPVGQRKRSAAGQSGAVPAVVPDGGIHALSGLRSLTQAHPPQGRQAQRRRAVRRRTCGSAGWRHKCLIRPTFLRKPAGSPRRPAQAQRRRAAGPSPLSSPSGAGPDPADRGQNSSAPAGSDPDTRPDSA
ncbi:Uncharacterised protein [Klebsiella quasipneumoniae]|nr:Uncharacterised protein [Klebsiella quasipneumoniae]